MAQAESLGYLAAVAVGAAVGLLGRALLTARPRPDRTTAVLCGIVGSALGFTVLRVIPPLTAHGFPWLRLFLAALLGTGVVMAVGQALHHSWRRQHPDLALAEPRALIAAGEGPRLEFKSTARWNLRTGERDERLEQVVAKTVAGFLNADGGTLLIGVDDAGAVVGVEYDYRLLRQPDRDRYELWLHDLLGGCLGRAVLSRLRIGFAHLDGHDVCRVDVRAAPGPVFLRPAKGGRAADFYVRLGNSTRLLLTDEAIDYTLSHWSRRPLVRLLGRRTAMAAPTVPDRQD